MAGVKEPIRQKWKYEPINGPRVPSLNRDGPEGERNIRLLRQGFSDKISTVKNGTVKSWKSFLLAIWCQWIDTLSRSGHLARSKASTSHARAYGPSFDAAFEVHRRPMRTINVNTWVCWEKSGACGFDCKWKFFLLLWCMLLRLNFF